MMLSAHSKDESTSSSLTQSVSSISSPSEKDSSVYPTPKLRHSSSTDKKFSLDGFDEKRSFEEANETLDESPGTLPDSVYEAQMSWWRAATRRMLIKSLKYESRILGQIQVCWTPIFPRKLSAQRH